MIEEGGMKEKGIFLALLLMVLASLVASGCVKAEDEPVEATRPEWKIGDQWKSTVRAPGEEESFLLRRVTKIEDFEGVPCYLQELVQGNMPDGERKNYCTLDLNEKAFVYHGTIKHKYDPALRWFDWPLTVGKKWEANYTDIHYTPMGRAEETVVESEFEVVKVEKIGVPAGEFGTFKIIQKIRRRTVMELWYSPEVKWFVKMRFYVRDKRGGRWSESELLEYKVG